MAKFSLLNETLIKHILDEAIQLLKSLGMEIHNEKLVSLLLENGAELKNGRILFPEQLICDSTGAAPCSFKLFDVSGNETHHFCGDNVYFTPGSTGLNILDGVTSQIRKPTTFDYITYLKVVSQLDNISSQSTAFIPSDVPPEISDSYRLFLSLLFCEKPVVTGTFTIESFEVMKDFQVIVRGNGEKLREKPLTVFSVCPTSPLKWSNVTSQNVMDCAHFGIPVEFISMPLSGLVAPVTLVGSLVQHTAETLSGVVISQIISPGSPILYGGSPAIFDMRHGTTPMGAIETMMIDCACCEIGKHLGFPTQAYISLSDSKKLDAQAGLESGMGALLAGLAGINSVSGPGMLDFESCHSIEKLVLDNDICGMVFRLLRGIQIKDDFPMQPLFEELLASKNLLGSDHTYQHFRNEQFFPSSVINRAIRGDVSNEMSLTERAHRRVEELVQSYEPSRLPEDIKKDLMKQMEEEAKKHGQSQLIFILRDNLDRV